MPTVKGKVSSQDTTNKSFNADQVLEHRAAVHGERCFEAVCEELLLRLV